MIGLKKALLPASITLLLLCLFSLVHVAFTTTSCHTAHTKSSQSESSCAYSSVPCSSAIVSTIRTVFQLYQTTTGSQISVDLQLPSQVDIPAYAPFSPQVHRRWTLLLYRPQLLHRQPPTLSWWVQEDLQLVQSALFFLLEQFLMLSLGVSSAVDTTQVGTKASPVTRRCIRTLILVDAIINNSNRRRYIYFRHDYSRLVHQIWINIWTDCFALACSTAVMSTTVGESSEPKSTRRICSDNHSPSVYG